MNSTTDWYKDDLVAGNQRATVFQEVRCSCELSLNPRELHPSLLSITENSLFILFQHLCFNEVLFVSRCCRILWRLSFELLSKLSINTRRRDLRRMNLSCVAIVAAHCKPVILLSFHGCSRISEGALAHCLSQQCPRLRLLNLFSGCDALALSRPRGASLSLLHESVNVEWCTEADAQVVPCVAFNGVQHSLRLVNLHCVNKFGMLFSSTAARAGAVSSPAADHRRLAGGDDEHGGRDCARATSEGMWYGVRGLGRRCSCVCCQSTSLRASYNL